jgi:hypothetical protein
MPADAPSSPKDVADLLEALARRIRNDPAFGKGTPLRPAPVTPASGMHVSAPPQKVDPFVDEEPAFGAVDLFTDERAVTVTVETRNVDPATVHVSLAEGKLLIGVGEGAGALRRDLALPAAVDEGAAFATFRNGVLDVVLPLKAHR